MLVRTDKVKRIINFIDIMGVCDSEQIATVFYNHQKRSLRYAQQKLTQLYEFRFIKRKKTFLGTRYIYYCKNFPQQLEHKYLLTELYTRICQKYGIENCTCECEYTNIEGMRPDGFITIKQGRRKYLFFVEIHISNNEFNYNKYLEVEKKRKHIHITQNALIFPYVLAVTDSEIMKHEDVEFIKIDTGFDNFNDVMEGIIGK